MTYPVTIHYVPGKFEIVEAWMQNNGITNYDLLTRHNRDTGYITVRIDFVHQSDAVQFKLAWADILVY